MLGARPELVELRADPRIELVAELARQSSDLDQAEHVGEILQAMRRGHPRRELQIHERRQACFPPLRTCEDPLSLGAGRDAKLLRASLAGVWLATALTVCHPYYREVGGEYLARLGLPRWIMHATDVGELGLAIVLLTMPMTSWLAALQIAMVAGFSAILALLDPMLLVSPFGFVSKNVPFCVVVAVAYLLEREGWTKRTERLLAIGMASVWITEGLFPKILFPQSVELDMVPALGVTFAPPWLLVGTIGVMQLASGIAVLVLPRRPRAWLLLAQCIALVVLPIVVGFLVPELWVHPFGPFSKNLPILAGTFLLYRRCSLSS